jgi:hypothetical protein
MTYLFKNFSLILAVVSVSLPSLKGIVSPDGKGLHMFSLDRFEV